MLSGDVPVTLPQMDANFCETSPGPVKVVLELMGVLAEARYRLPMTRPSDASCAHLARVLSELGLLADLGKLGGSPDRQE